MTAHNKKRNSGLIFEFLTRAISNSLIENDNTQAQQIINVLNRHYEKNSELFKEYRLMNALVKTTVSSPLVASSIINQAKEAVKSHNFEKLTKEKNLLLKKINTSLNENVFDYQVEQYRIYATLQTLFNEWRAPTDLNLIAQYEDQLMTWLTTTKPVLTEVFMNDGSVGTGRFLTKIMMKKLNEKYQNSLSNEQKDLIKTFVYSSKQNDGKQIKNKLSETKNKILQKIDEILIEYKDNSFLLPKLYETKKLIQEEELSTVNEETISRFMTYLKLTEEIEHEDE